MLELENISKIFETENIETTALNAVCLKILKGDFISVMGPSGCGKSTLLNIVGMLDRPSSGEYFFQGEKISDLSENKVAKFRKKYIGFVFQNFNLVDQLTVEENIELPLLYAGVPRQLRIEKVRAVMNQLRLENRSSHKPKQLSGGQQQRVAVARAVVNKPKLILADEPTGNLDSKNGLEVMSILEEINSQGVSVLMVTHSHEYASRAKKRIKMLDGFVKIC